RADQRGHTVDVDDLVGGLASRSLLGPGVGGNPLDRAPTQQAAGLINHVDGQERGIRHRTPEETEVAGGRQHDPQPDRIPGRRAVAFAARFRDGLGVRVARGLRATLAGAGTTAGRQEDHRQNGEQSDGTGQLEAHAFYPPCANNRPREFDLFPGTPAGGRRKAAGTALTARRIGGLAVGGGGGIVPRGTSAAGRQARGMRIVTWMWSSVSSSFRSASTPDLRSASTPWRKVLRRMRTSLITGSRRRRRAFRRCSAPAGAGPASRSATSASVSLADSSRATTSDSTSSWACSSGSRSRARTWRSPSPADWARRRTSSGRRSSRSLFDTADWLRPRAAASSSWVSPNCSITRA